MDMAMMRYSMENLERDHYVELNKFDRLISNLAISMPSTIVNSIIITAALWDIISRGKLIAWCSVNIGYALSRYSIIYYYKKNFNKSHLLAWKIGTFISFAIAGILFGSSGIFLMDPTRFEYVIFIYFIAGGMAVGSAGSYHNDLPIYFVYSSTVFMIPTVSLYFLHMGISTPMIILGLVFYIIVSIMAVRLSRDMKDSLVLRFDNNQLVLRLEEEKIHTDQLNAELLKKNKELNELSLADPLTSLRNRRYLFEIVMPEIDAFGRDVRREIDGQNNRLIDARKGYGIMIVDIDHFKRVNDNYGHDSGDMVLVQFAAKLKESVRRDDVVIRFGGEEFIIVLKNVDEQSAADIAKKINHHIHDSTFTLSGNRTINLTCSIGFVFHIFHESDDPDATFEKMISIADSALYYAKSHGRNASAKAVFKGKTMDYVLL